MTALSNERPIENSLLRRGVPGVDVGTSGSRASAPLGAGVRRGRSAVALTEPCPARHGFGSCEPNHAFHGKEAGIIRPPVARDVGPYSACLASPSMVPRAPIWTRVGFRSSGFGTCTSSTPSLTSA
jgi:hypothetical protein